MPQSVDVAGFGIVEFPDGYSPEQIKSELDTRFAKGQPQAAPAPTEPAPTEFQGWEPPVSMEQPDAWARRQGNRSLVQATPFASPEQIQQVSDAAAGETPLRLAGDAPGAVLKYSAGAIGKGLQAATGKLLGTGDSVEDLLGAVWDDKTLPVEEAASKITGVKGALARGGLSIEATIPKLAMLAAFPESILAQSVAAGGIFGFDDKGNFSPKSAIIGALMPGVGKLGTQVATKAIVSALEGGSKALQNTAAQWFVEELGQQAALNALLIAGDSPELIKLYQTDPEAAKHQIQEIVGQNLAWALFGGARHFAGKKPTATQQFIFKNREKYGDIADTMITRQLAGKDGQEAIQAAIEEAKARQFGAFGGKSNAEAGAPEGADIVSQIAGERGLSPEDALAATGAARQPIGTREAYQNAIIQGSEKRVPEYRGTAQGAAIPANAPEIRSEASAIPSDSGGNVGSGNVAAPPLPEVQVEAPRPPAEVTPPAAPAIPVPVELTEGQKLTLRNQLAKTMTGRAVSAEDLQSSHIAHEVKQANGVAAVTGGEALPPNLTWEDAIKAGVLEKSGNEVRLAGDEIASKPPEVAAAPPANPEVSGKVEPAKVEEVKPEPQVPKAAEVPSGKRSPHDFEPALMIEGKPVTGAASHTDIANAQLKTARDMETVFNALNDDNAHVFVDKAGKTYSRAEAAAALGETEPLQSQRLKELKEKNPLPTEPEFRNRNLIIRERDAAKEAVNEAARKLKYAQKASNATSPKGKRAITKASGELVKAEEAHKLLVDELAERDRVKPYASGASRGAARFDNETKRVGDDILSWMRDEGHKVLSRTQAQKRGGQFWAESNGNWDGAIDLKLPPHHKGAIYGSDMPGDVAQAAWDAKKQGKWAGSMADATPQALWDTIRAASAKRMGSLGGETGEAAILEKGEKELVAWQTATKRRSTATPVKVDPTALAKGEKMEVGGEKLEVISVDADGNVVVRGGDKFGNQEFNQESEPFWVTKYTPVEREVDFAPEETAEVVPAKPEAPKPPEPKAEVVKPVEKPAEPAVPVEKPAVPVAEKPEAVVKPAEPQDPWAVGQHVQVADDPQTHTIVKETTDPKFPAERIFLLKNDRTGYQKEYDVKSLSPATLKEKTSGAKKPKRDLDAELEKLVPGIDTKQFPDEASKKAAIKRYKALKKDPLPAVEEVDTAFDPSLAKSHYALSDDSIKFGDPKATSVLERMLKAGLFDKRPAIKQIVEHLLKRYKDYTYVHFISESNMTDDMRKRGALAFYSNGNTPGFERGIYLVEGKWNGKSTGSAVRVFLHEYIHALTADFIRNNSSHPLVQRLGGLAVESLRKFKPSEIYPERPYGLSGAERARYGGGDMYGHSEAALEFVAEALASKNFQEFLANQRAPKWALAEHIKTMWGALVDTVRKILGLPKNSMLEESVRASLELIEEANLEGVRENAPAVPDRAHTLDWLMTEAGEREEEAPKKNFRQFMGVRRGGKEYEVESIQKTVDAVREKVFDGTTGEVNEETTASAWDLLGKMTRAETRNDFVRDVVEEAGGQGSGAALLNELKTYATKLAARGDTGMLRTIWGNQDFIQTLNTGSDASVVGHSASGLDLRYAKEAADSPLWKSITTYTKAVNEAAGQKLGVGEEAFTNLIRAMDDLVSKIGIEEFDKLATTDKTKAGKTIADLLEENSPERKAAEQVVLGIPEGQIPERAPGIEGAPKVRATILETVYEWLKRDVGKDDEAMFTTSLKDALVKLRLTEEQAQAIADGTWVRKNTVESARRKALWDSELRRLDNLANKTAEGFIKTVDVAEWKKLAQPNEVRDIIRNALKRGGDLAETEQLGWKQAIDENNMLGFKSALIEKLKTAGVDEGTAQRLADAITSKRSQDLANAQMKAIERAAASQNVYSLVEDFRNAPYLSQNNPEWRLASATRWFESNGLTKEQAVEAAKMFDKQFVNAMVMAAEKEARRLLEKGSIGRLGDILSAVRLGLTDPSKNWIDEIANRKNFRPISAEQQKLAAEIDMKLSNPELSPEEIGALQEQLYKIFRHVGWTEGNNGQAFAERYVSGLLSGPRTLMIQWGPAIQALRDYPTAAISDPKNSLNLASAMFTAWKNNFLPQLKYAWQKRAYGFHIEHAELQHQELRKRWEAAEKEYNTTTSPVVKAHARLKQLYNIGHFVVHLLNSMDQAMMATAREWKLVYYASSAFKDAGLGTGKVSELMDAMEIARQNAYDTAIDAGLDPLTAKIRANWTVTHAVEDFVSNHTGEMSMGNRVMQAAEHDIYSMVGRQPKGITEMDEGFLSKPINGLIKKLSEAKKDGSTSILATALFGFVNIPFRTMRFYSSYSPYGLLRYGINKYRTNRGMDTYWKQSFANELQAKARFREAIAGTVVMGLATAWAAANNTSDDKAGSEKFGAYITGNGPQSRVLRDAWDKKGWKPFSINFVINGRVVPIPLTRIGESIMFPFMLAASVDDAQWKRKAIAATGKTPPSLPSSFASTLVGTLFQMTGQKGILQGMTQWSRLAEGGNSTPKIAAKLGSTVGSAFVVPLKQLFSSISDMFAGPMDQSSVSSIIASQFPIVGLPLQTKAVNRFGDPLYDRSFYGIIQRTGVPVAFQVAQTEDNVKLYDGLLLQKGAAAPDLRRFDIEEKYGPLSDSDFAKFAQISGSTLKKMVMDNVDSLKEMPPEQVKSFLESSAHTANDLAAAEMNLQPQKATAARSSGGSGGGSGSSGGGVAMPKLPSAPSAAVLGSGPATRAAASSSGADYTPGGGGVASSGYSGGGGGGGAAPRGMGTRRVSLGGGARVRKPRLVTGKLKSRMGRRVRTRRIGSTIRKIRRVRVRA